MPESHPVRTGVLFSDVAPEITVTLPAFFVEIIHIVGKFALGYGCHRDPPAVTEFSKSSSQIT